MGTYLLVILTSTGLAFLARHVNKEYQIPILVILILTLSTFSGLRGVGTDTIGYNRRFMSIDHVDTSDFSLIYVIMNVIKRMGLGYQTVIYIISLTTTILAVSVLWKYRYQISFPFAIFSYLLQFYQMSFNTFRQILAASFFVLAVSKFGEKKYKQVAISYIIACLIHSSVIPFGMVFILSKYIYDRRYLRKRTIIYIIIAVLIYTMPIYVNYVSRLLLSKLPHYAAYFVNFEYQPIGIGIIRYMILAIFPVVATLLLKRKYKYLQASYKKIEYCSFFSIVGTEIWLLSYVSTAVIYRASYNFLLALPILHGFIAKRFPKNYRYITLTILTIFLVFFWYYDYGVLNSGETVPYITGLQKW